MKELLDRLLPRFYPDLEFMCVPHEGKQSLEKSIPRRIRAWREPGVRFLVVRDNDGGDCIQFKSKLLTLCREAGRDDTCVRIACQELEAWYIGEPAALARAYSDDKLLKLQDKKNYRYPDRIVNPSKELEKLIPSFQKVSGARRLGQVMTREGNRSPSFVALTTAIEAAMQE